MPFLRFLSAPAVLIGLFLISAGISVMLSQILDPHACLALVIIGMIMPQYALRVFRPIFIRRRPETESTIAWLNLYSLMLGFLALLTVLAIHGLGPDYRSAATLVIVAGLVWVGRDLLQFAREHQLANHFSEVRF